jgi:hypothetical protein
LQIEPKGRDVVEEPNRLHVVLASNSEWVIPAGAHERRFAVQEVADTYRQDAGWFGPIYQEMRSGGLEAMLYDLLHYDLDDWHPRQIVRTPALTRQQEESLSALDQWWLELLQTAVLEGASELASDEAVSNEYEEEISDTDGYGGQRKRTVKRKAFTIRLGASHRGSGASAIPALGFISVSPSVDVRTHGHGVVAVVAAAGNSRC